MKILAIIPARSGSKRLKNKNFLKFNKKPLFLHIVDKLKKIKKIKTILISTDSTWHGIPNFLEVCLQWSAHSAELLERLWLIWIASMLEISFEQSKCNNAVESGPPLYPT